MDIPHFTIPQDFVKLSTVRPVEFRPHVMDVGSPRHNHEFAELALIQEGSIEHRTFCDGLEHRELVHAGDFLVIPPGPIHGYDVVEGDKECKIVNIYYLAEWFLWDLNLLWNEGLVPLFFASHLLRRPEGLRIWSFKLSDREMHSVERELEDIATEYDNNSPSLLFVRGAFVKILVVLAKAWHRQTPEGDFHFRIEIWKGMQAIDRCIKEGRAFRVANFAREVGLATGSFSRLFHAATGMAPSEYYGRRRTQHAAHLLLDSNLSVSEIAVCLGFCDAAHLSRAFSKNERMSPRAFRSRYKRS